VISRPMRYDDIPQVKALHERMGIDYRFPLEDKDGHPILSPADFAQVIEHNGVIIGASINRIVAESMMWMQPDLDPRDKWTAIRLGQQGMLKWARENGVRELIAAICSNVVTKFTKRLQMLKWESHRDGWALWSRRVS